ncbi:MAG TPA: amidohydrolase family protein, partial [Polyangiaceae bacterium]|nr:amidohydrolase family protein [Polyangiaceae bacterium]
ELVGTRAIFDTSYCGALPEAELRALIRAHGTDRVAFGSDFPWVRAAPQLARLAGLGLTADELADIRHRTAARLLG